MKRCKRQKSECASTTYVIYNRHLTDPQKQILPRAAHYNKLQPLQKSKKIRSAFMAKYIIIVAKSQTADSWVLLNRRSLREAAVLLWALNAMFHV